MLLYMSFCTRKYHLDVSHQVVFTIHQRDGHPDRCQIVRGRLGRVVPFQVDDRTVIVPTENVCNETKLLSIVGAPIEYTSKTNGRVRKCTVYELYL